MQLGERMAQEICNGAHGDHVMIGDVRNAEKCQWLVFKWHQDLCIYFA